MARRRRLCFTARPFGKVTGEIQAGTTVNVLMGLWQRLGVKDEAKALEACVVPRWLSPHPYR